MACVRYSDADFLTNFLLLLITDAESVSPIVNVSIPIGGTATFDCMIPELNHSFIAKRLLVNDKSLGSIHMSHILQFIVIFSSLGCMDET